MNTGQRKKIRALTGIIGQNSLRRTFLEQCWTCTCIDSGYFTIYIFIDKNMLKTLIDVKFLWHFFVLDMFFFTQKLGCSIGLAKRAFFSHIFYGAPLPDWDEGLWGLLVEVVTVALEVDSWLFCRFPFFFFYFQFNRQSRNKIMSLYTDSMSAQIGITTMFAILVAADLVGNTIVCLIIIVFHDMR